MDINENTMYYEKNKKGSPFEINGKTLYCKVFFHVLKTKDIDKDNNCAVACIVQYRIYKGQDTFTLNLDYPEDFRQYINEKEMIQNAIEQLKEHINRHVKSLEEILK